MRYYVCAYVENFRNEIDVEERLFTPLYNTTRPINPLFKLSGRKVFFHRSTLWSMTRSINGRLLLIYFAFDPHSRRWVNGLLTYNVSFVSFEPSLISYASLWEFKASIILFTVAYAYSTLRTNNNRARF